MIFARVYEDFWSCEHIWNILKREREGETYVVAHFQSALQVRFHWVAVERHEEGVDHDTQRDEQFDERVEHEERHQFLELEPDGRAVPNAKHVQPLEHQRRQALLDVGTFVVVVRH